jgi:CRP/FNR family transcriptional regulator, cyclic AMP receptor protein
MMPNVPSFLEAALFSYMVPVESLRTLELFSGCDDKLLRKLSRLGTEVHAKARQVLAREGEVGREFYVIVDGKATVLHEGQEIAALQRGDFFGEMALVDGKPRSATVTASSPMTLYVFDPREFFSLLDGFPPVSRKILTTLAGRLRHAQDEQHLDTGDASA